MYDTRRCAYSTLYTVSVYYTAPCNLSTFTSYRLAAAAYTCPLQQRAHSSLIIYKYLLKMTKLMSIIIYHTSIAKVCIYVYIYDNHIKVAYLPILPIFTRHLITSLYIIIYDLFSIFKIVPIIINTYN